MAYNATPKKLFDRNETSKEIPPIKEPIKIYLRVRPLTPTEKNEKEDQGCINIKRDDLVELRAPPSSFAFKSCVNSDATSQFSFSHIFPDVTDQKTFFDKTMLSFVEDVLNGHNGLIFTYGVTNSGKTYTVQGTPKDGGILPRALDVIFNSISGKKHNAPNLKPTFFQNITSLDEVQEAKEIAVRNAIFAYGQKENEDLTILKRLNSTTKTDNAAVQSRDDTLLSNISVIQKSGGSMFDADIEADVRSRVSDATNIDIDVPCGVKFGIWVSFMEIYNELIHDLLQLDSIGKGKKRPSLKLGEDKNGNPYVKGLTEVFVTSSDEAYKILRVGQKHRHMAATKLNQLSSRSHAIFSIKLLKIIEGKEPQVSRISRLSIVDLAGSERYSKTDAFGDSMKEASNINCSIMTLGKCISTLRYNQEHKNHPTIVPFRESKLTRLFQGYFLGKGKATMIVNISPCASVFDETYNVLKFSAIAKEVKMKAERATELWAVPPTPKILCTPLKAPSTPAHKRIPLCIVTPSTTMTKKERSLNDPRDFSYDELVNIVRELNEKVKKERREKVLTEKNVRVEITTEMSVLMDEMREEHKSELAEQKESLNQMMEDRLDLMAKTAEKQRKRRRVEYENESGKSVSANPPEDEKMKPDEMQAMLDKYVEHINHVEAENKKLRQTENSCKEAEGTLRIQNKSMKDMQKKLQDMNDEIERLREELDDSQRDTRSDQKNGIEEDNSRINHLENELEALRKLKSKENEEFQVKLKILDKEKTDRIEELENKLAVLEKGLTPELSSCENCYDLARQLEELKLKLNEKEEELSLLQFEYDEGKCKVERYESLLTQHKETLVDSESIIEQLNEQLFILKTQLANYEERSQYVNPPMIEVGINTSEMVHSSLDTQDASMNTSDMATTEIGINTSIINAEEEKSSGSTAEVSWKTSMTNVEIGTNTSNEQTLGNLVAMSANSPRTSPVKVSMQQTVKQLEKLLQEAKRDLEKKASIIMTRNNCIQQLELQLEEKSNNIVEEKQALEEQLASLTQQLNNTDQVLEEKNKLLCTTCNELNTWKDKSESFQSKLDKTSLELTECQTSSNTRHQEMQKLLDEYMSKISVLTNSNVELKKEIGPMKVALAELEDENKVLMQKDEVQTHCIAEYMQKEKDLEAAVTLGKEELNSIRKQAEEKEVMLSKMETEKENLLSNTQKLKSEMDDRRKSRVVYQDTIESSLEDFKERISALQQENVENLKEISVLNQTLLEVQSKSRDMEMRHGETLSAKDGKLDQLESSKQMLTEKLKTSEGKVMQLEAESYKLTSSNMKLTMKINRIEQDLRDKDEANKMLESEIESLQRKHSDVVSKHEKLKVQSDEMEKRNAKLLSENEEHSNNILKLEEELQLKGSDLDALTKELDKTKMDVDSKLKKISELEEEKVKSLELIENLTNEAEEVHEETLSHLSKINEYEKEIIQSKALIQSLTIEAGELKFDNSSFVQAIEKCGIEKGKYSHEVEALKSTIKELEDIKKHREGTSEKEGIQDKALIESLKHDVEELNSKNSSFAKTIGELKEEVNSLKNAIKKLEDERKEATNVDLLIKQMNDIKTQNENYVKEINKYKTELGLKEEYICDYEDKKKEYKEMKDLLAQKEKTLKQLKKDLDKQGTELKKIREEKQIADDELLAMNMAADTNLSTCVRRSARKSKQIKSLIDNSANLVQSSRRKLQLSKGSKGLLADCSGASKLDDLDEDEVVIDKISIACSPVQIEGGLESTRFDHDTSGVTKSKLVIDMTSTQNETLELINPVPKKKKRLLSQKISLFEASTDGQTSVTEGSTLEATPSMGINRRRVTRSAKKASRDNLL